MGIAYLWDLLLACGRRVPIQFLRGKILAIDASIWITRADAVFGNTTLTIRSILTKIISLMKIGVKPIFVFDGTPPLIKRNCLDQRRRRRLEYGEKQMKKMAQIEVLKVLKGEKENPKKKKKLQLTTDRRGEEQEEESESQQQSIIEIELKEAPTEVDNIKAELFGELLFEKYKLLKQMYPHYFFKYNDEEFFNLSTEEKIQVVEQTEENVYVEQKSRKVRNETCEQALYRQVKIIKNKTRINELKQEIHRKLVSKIEHKVNEEKNLETVVGTYQGKTFQQVRRVQKKPVNNIANIVKKGMEKRGEMESVVEEVGEREGVEEVRYPELKEGESFLNFLQAGFGGGGDGSSEEKEIDEFEAFEDEEKGEGEVNFVFQTPTARLSEKQPNHDETLETQSKTIPSSSTNQQPSKNNPLEQQYPAFNKIIQSQLSLTGQKANIELRQLLDLLGLPYVLAPSEAEAQCAELQKQGLVEGIITDDSDVFAFGAKNVYRGVFQNDVKYYGEIEYKKLNFSQEQFIIFALFTGSDYTQGVKGIGLVNAIQIIKSFNTISKLVHFREWAKLPDLLNPENAEFYKTTNEEERKFFEFHKNFKNHWHVDESFPSQEVIDAYVDPKVETKFKKFEFGEPNVGVIEKLLRERMELSAEDAERKIRELKEAVREMKAGQTKILDYFSISTEAIGRIRSKRVENALK